MAGDKLGWWREARFGLFIHWGLYSIPAGIWKGREVPGLGEQILRFGEIPMSEYEKLAAEFNPINFDADAIVRLAVDSGMKYLVVTAKHHDGFALFKSEADLFNVVDATPFGRDIVAELAEACAKAGIKFCIYYSQRQDWHHPDGAWNEWKGQYPVSLEERDFDFNRCMNGKCLPQMKELMTRYGPIGLVWYDTPVDSTRKQSKKFTELVHRKQPDCLVCDRVGNGYGDYAVLGDNEFPYCSQNMDGEVPATLNHSWGYKSTDHNWKSVESLLYSLIRSASNGCNYLLNIGPKADGTVP
ncbi:MAG: alpha-L-fucosidase, partial [Verrucomicrobiota bacterium]|nr:alpha-L-fucosidase [Verrucomicrobiota bacterium]